MPQYIVKEHTREVCISVPLSANAAPPQSKGDLGVQCEGEQISPGDSRGAPAKRIHIFWLPCDVAREATPPESLRDTGGCPPYLSLTKAKNRSLPRTVFGADRRIRTADLVITNDVLCQLSYISKQAKNAFL